MRLGQDGATANRGGKVPVRITRTFSGTETPQAPLTDRDVVEQKISRRGVIGKGLLLGAGALLLGGCQTSRSRPAYGRVGDPLPGDDYASGRIPESSSGRGRAEASGEDRGARARRLLDEWRSRSAEGVIPRTSWASRGPIVSRADRMGSINRITVHHDGMNAFTSRRQADAMARIEAIRNAHVNMNWADIGYHYIIDPAGRVYEGRPLGLQGAHVRDNNERNLGIMVLGNYMDQRPTSDSVRALEEFIAQAMRTHRVSASRVYTHREFAPTACPGDSLQRSMLAMRSGSGNLAKL